MSNTKSVEVNPMVFNQELKAEVSASDFISYNNAILGEVLTLVDASLPESDQRKALKSLIKQCMWRNYDLVWKWLNEQKNGSGSTFPLSSPGSLASVE
jgi:hypothetical protein